MDSTATVTRTKSPLITNLRRLPTPSGPRFELRHRYIRVTATRGYFSHDAYDTVQERIVRGFRTIGEAMTAVQALNAGGVSS